MKDVQNGNNRQHVGAQDPKPTSFTTSPSESPRFQPKISKTTDSTRSSRKSHSLDDTSSGTFKPVYPYPENKDVIVWESKDPKRAMTTTISTLDTRANMSSGSIMSRTRRIMDQKARQRQIDIQKDFSGQQEAIPPVDGANKADESLRMGSRKSSQRSSSPHISFQDSTSPTASPTQRNSGLSSFSKSKHSKDGGSRGTPSRKSLQRALAGPIFISNPRGVAPTPSPDVSLELVRSSSRNGHRQTMQVQERMRRYETQLDQRNETVLANNQRLMELKLLLEAQGQALVVRSQDDYDNDDFDDDDDDAWEEIQIERERERAQLAEANNILEESQILQRQLKKDLEQEQANNKELESRIEAMSKQLKEVLELGEVQTAELKQVRLQSSKDREQWERQLSEEKHKRDQLQMSMTTSFSRKEREITEEIAKQRIESQAEVHKLTSDVKSLNQQIQELVDKLCRSEDRAEVAILKHADESKEYQSQIQKLEKQLAIEHDRMSEDQEARARVRVRVNELAQSVEQKEDEVHELRVMLGERDEALERRQAEIDDALSLVRTLEDQLREQQLESQENQRREQEKHVKELKQQKGELREMKHKLAGEKELHREFDNRVQILMETHQKSHQINEAKIQQLEEELEKQTLKLSQLNSTSSSATSTIHQLQERIEEQERILLDKEDRIQELDQELKLAQKQAQNVVADLEQDLTELENDRSRLDNLLQKAHQEVDEARMKVKELELQLNHKDHELSHELNQRHDQEQLLLERLLNDMESTQPPDELDEHRRDNQFNNDDSADGSVQYFYSRLQEKIRETKRERLHLNQDLADMRQQLEQYNTEIDAQQEQLMRVADDRKSLKEQLVQLQNDLATSEHNQRQLRQQLQKNDQDARQGRAIPKDLSSSTSRKQQRRYSQEPSQETEELKSKVLSLKEQVSTLDLEKQQLMEQLDFTRAQLQDLDETVQDQSEAAKSIQAKYTEKISSLQKELVKHRKMIIRQEGQMFLYLSVIEKLKMENREIRNSTVN
ncbi:hypothetical protein BGZ46_003905 [Entomortierella lignicola]|nr:hypothetical protein BGZ46_003905 [Entomortierella lignicola]